MPNLALEALNLVPRADSGPLSLLHFLLVRGYLHRRVHTEANLLTFG